MKKALKIIGLVLASHTAYAQELNDIAPAKDNSPDAQIVERGQDFVVYERTKSVRLGDGKVDTQTSRFTLVENGLHYLEDGEWRVSEDLVEPFPDGAIARRGPNQAIFSPTLNVETVFDIQTSGGERLRGGVRAIQATDLATGKSVTLATVKHRAPGELVPPNLIVYRDAFDGLAADVVLDWRHNYFAHDVVIRERPELPRGFDPQTTRLEVVTEIVESPQPQIREQLMTLKSAKHLDSVPDHVVIQLDSLAMIMGKAFLSEDGGAWTTAGPGEVPVGASTVLKQWATADDGRTFLIESVSWSEANPDLNKLPDGNRAGLPAARAYQQVAAARVWPRPVGPLSDPEPIQLAQAAYEPAGYVMDFFIIPDNGTPTTFQSGQTYYIKTSYYSGSTVTFQSGATIKYKNNAYMLLYGTMNFPSSGSEVVFTSRDDNAYGEVITGVPGEAPSDGNPTDHIASQALMVYYVNFSTTVQNVRIRWANIGIQYDGNQGVYTTHNVSNSHFEQSNIGIQNNLPAGYVNLNSVTRCSVITPLTGYGYTYGSMTVDCGVVSVARVNDPSDDSTGDTNKNSQSECSFVVVDSSTIVAAFWDTHHSVYGLKGDSFSGIVAPRSTGWSVSTNGGTSFNDKGALPPTTPANTWQGDAGDPVMARNTITGHANYGHIYLAAIPSRESDTCEGLRIWRSTNDGQTFSLFNSNVLSGAITKADKPMISVNNYANSTNAGHIYAAFTGYSNGVKGIQVTSSTDGGISWGSHTALGEGHGASIAIRPDGTVYVFYLRSVRTSQPNVDPEIYDNSIRYSYLRVGSTWITNQIIPVHNNANYVLHSTEMNGRGHLKRHKTANEDDYFRTNADPRTVVNPANGHIFLVFGDLPSPGLATDRGDIYVLEGTPNTDDSLTWIANVRIKDDNSETDQWLPDVTISPDGTKLFIGYYNRQEDIINNSFIKAYGAVADISFNGLANAWFDFIPISDLFKPLFAGTTTSTPATATWKYDHVWIQKGICLDAVNAQIVGFGNDGDCTFEGGTYTIDTYVNFMADDYTWVAADDTYFYFAWCDRSDSFGTGAQSRPDANVRFAKIRQ